jgi:predicted MFS family arabinose efflux permease
MAATTTLERATTTTAPRSDRAPVEPEWERSAFAAFALQVSILLLFLAASSAPTPLYSVYEAKWGFSPITVTVVFAVYAIAVLVALLTVGSLSDHIGRRPVLLAAIVLEVAAMIVFITAEGVSALVVARVVQGLATGAAVGAIGAGLIDIHRVKGTVANGVGALAGTATGAIGSGVVVQYLPAPTHLVYLVIAIVVVLQGVGVVFMPESSARKNGAVASLRPRFSLPPAARGTALMAFPALVAVWSLAGFYGSLGPALVRRVVGSNSLVLGGLALFTIAAAASITIYLIRNSSPRLVMLGGTVALLVGVAITFWSIDATSAVAFFVGATIAGSGFGAGFQGALRIVLPLAAPHERAGVLSMLYVVSYLAFGLPAIAAGYLVVHDGGLLTTAREYAVFVMVLATIALAGLSLRRIPQTGNAGDGSALPECLAGAR